MAADLSIAARRREDLHPEAAGRLSAWLRGYQPLSGVPDELFDPTGWPRDYWLDFLGDFAEYPDQEFKSRFSMASRHIRDAGVTYRVYGEENERSWPLNPLPLILSQDEWGKIAEGVEQRANLIEALLQDFYGEARLVAEGALPAAALAGSPDFIRAMRGVKPPGGRFMHTYAADLGRGPDGRWWVLDDRTQAPSGAGYALENRLILSRAFPNLYNAMNVQRLAPFFDQLRKGLAAAADRADPRICLLTPGPFSETYFEQAHLARYLGFLLVEGDDLVVRDGKVYVRTIAGLKRADVILRRVDADFLDPLELNSASHLGVPGLLDAIRSGGVAVLNMPGAGVLQSKALLGFLPKLCRRLLGEDLKMPNIATWWCGQPNERAWVEAQLEQLAVGPAFNGAIGMGAFSRPRLWSDLAGDEKDAFRRHFQDRPGDFVGQDVVKLSTTPVLRDGRLEPAPFVLRVYATATPEGMKVMPGGFCRVSEQADVRAVSMGENARTADVWVVSNRPVERVSLLASRDDVKIRRILGHLPSRAADNLFWLGRYVERAEATLRLVRSLSASLMDSDSNVHGVGETLAGLRTLLIDWGALPEDEEADAEGKQANDDGYDNAAEAHSITGGRVIDAARAALYDREAFGSAISLVRAARRTASSMRERLSGDFWALLVKLETSLAENALEVQSEAEILQQVEGALQILAALSGLTQENMNRIAGWRFIDMGRRLERGVNSCRFARAFAHDDATLDDLDLLLDLADSQITYRARYLVGLALTPVRDMVLLDPFNPRSLIFQVEAMKEHLAALPALVADGMLEEPMKIVLRLAAELETGEAVGLNAEEVLACEQSLLRLSTAIGDRYFLKGAQAAPTVKLDSLA